MDSYEETLKKKIVKKQKEIRKKLSRAGENFPGAHETGFSTGESSSLNQSLSEAVQRKVRGKLQAVKLKVEAACYTGDASLFPASLPRLLKSDGQHFGIEEEEDDGGYSFFVSDGDERFHDLQASYSITIQEPNKGFIREAMQISAVTKDSIPMGDSVESEEILPALLERKPAEYESNKLKDQKQEAYIFVPSNHSVCYSLKLPQAMEPRMIEDEGLYAPRKPECYRNCINKMEQRLIQEVEGKRWFEMSGEIVALPSPIKQTVSCWKNTSNIRHPALETIYIKAMSSKQECCIINPTEGLSLLYQLDLNLSHLVFTHHPLFSREDVLAAKLIQLYEGFQHRQQHNVTHLLNEKLIALTNTAKRAHTHIEGSQLQNKQLEEYRWQMKETQRLLDIEKKKDISLEQNMVKVWKQIKALRTRQGHVNTAVKLQFRKLEKKTDYEIGDSRESSLPNFVPQGEFEDTCNRASDLNTEEYFQDTAELACRATRRRAKGKGLRNPNDAILIPCLTMDADVTPRCYSPKHEQMRRNKVEMQKYFIKMKYNGKQVFRTGVYPLNLGFKVDFQQAFSIQILNWPEHLCLEIHEITTKGKHLLANLYLPIPKNTLLKGKEEFEEAEFSNDKVIIPDVGEVGSNVPFLLGGRVKKELCLLTSGKLCYSLHWAVDAHGKPMAPPACHLKGSSCNITRPSTSVDNSKYISAQALPELDDEIRIDPNDPRCSDCGQPGMIGKDQEPGITEYFRFDELQEEFNFATEEELKECKRFQLLVHRNAEPQDSNRLREIPLFDQEIPESLMQEFERQLDKEISLTDIDPITAQRAAAANLITKIRSTVLKQFIKSKRRTHLSDIVNEYDECTSVSQLSLALFRIAEPRRLLKPQRQERKKILTQVLSDGDVKVLVRISRAFNIPVRKQDIPSTSVVPGSACSLSRISSSRHLLKSSQSHETLNEVSVSPYVEISFQKAVYQTTVADGSHPCWNEELQLDLTAPAGDYSFSGLSQIKEHVIINVFDEVVVEKHEDNCLRGCSTHSYIKKNWLGSLSFPFASLLHHSKISGTFEVNTPPVLLGYSWSKTNIFPNEDFGGEDGAEQSFITIYVTINPHISPAGQDLEKESGNGQFWTISDHEDDKLLQNAHSFHRSCKALFPERRILSAVFDSEGQSVLVKRYFKALNPPQDLLDAHSDDIPLTCDLVARFVSLIPSLADIVDDSEACEDCSCWMTSEQTIGWAVGNQDEHAVLLCNYFSFFEKKAWVLLGTSLLEGPVAYVLTEDLYEYSLWNPMTGHCCKQLDAFCPLQSIDCLINAENVWFNVQNNSAPMAVKFDLSKEILWKPLFSKPVQQTLNSPWQQISYLPTNRSMVEELEKRVERTLKNKLMEWRSIHPTRWNRQCIAIFRKILPKLEFSIGSNASVEENEFKNLKKDFEVTGFPLRLPYTNIQSIIQAVHNTEVHATEIPSTEFAVAVYIYPYPNNILSVWVYLASLVRFN